MVLKTFPIEIRMPEDVAQEFEALVKAESNSFKLQPMIPMALESEIFWAAKIGVEKRLEELREKYGHIIAKTK